METQDLSQHLGKGDGGEGIPVLSAVEFSRFLEAANAPHGPLRRSSPTGRAGVLALTAFLLALAALALFRLHRADSNDAFDTIDRPASLEAAAVLSKDPCRSLGLPISHHVAPLEPFCRGSY